jgi:hypothetical protein
MHTMRNTAKLALACVVALSSHSASARAQRPRCAISVDNKKDKVRINGVALRALFGLDELRKAIGKPSRTVRINSKERFERLGFRGSRPSSQIVTVTDYHHVYDALGLVFSTRNGRWSKDRTPVLLYVVFRKQVTFAHRDRPAVLPRKVFRGTLTINGSVLDAQRPPVPADVGYRTEKFPLFGTSFSPTSRATAIDSIYSYAGQPAIRIFLDNASDRRAAYVQIR